MYLGIDFSGGAAPWQARCAKPTVWIASLEDEASPRLTDLRPVQDLSGTEDPFAKLVSRLRCGDFVAAGIDAPFSIPAEYLPPGGHRALLAHVATLPDAADRPFPSGAALVALAEEVEPLRSKKPMRDTEGVWAKRGVNTRSTLWNGPRGGAPFTAACLALLGRAGRPLWPWDNGPGMLVEAFPAAQLKTWGLPHNGYGKPEQRDARETILAGFAGRLLFNAAQRATMLETPDALDAVLAAFAGIAAIRHGVPDRIPADGLIAVAEDRLGQEGLPATTPPRNLMDVASRSAHDEIFEDVLRRPGVRIERIVSRGHTTPPEQPFLQEWDEWVLLLEGAARVEFRDLTEHALTAGDHLLIPAGMPHRVTCTADPTIWLAVHIGKPDRP